MLQKQIGSVLCIYSDARTEQHNKKKKSDEDEDEPEPAQKPIGHGRDRSKSERHNSEHSDPGEFELSLSLGTADWAVAKLTPDQIGTQSHVAWSAPNVAKVDVTVQADETAFSSGTGTLRLVHGNYRSAASTNNITNSWAPTSNDKTTQTKEQVDEHKR